ncbi:MAG: glycerol-3-phosphate acyltransferase [Ignavibacteria bacterium]|nr:glycerol-3-phosphate acyltransferase [Ignavibacteria bacterium]
MIGSIPTAYILIKIKYGKNLSEEGSGNIGARNTLDVTGSKADGIIVLLADLIKGLVPAFLLITYGDLGKWQLIIPLTLLVAGHNFSVWIKFKGGRGLATAAGVFIALDFIFVILWLAFYFIADIFIKNANVSTVIALLAIPLTVWIFPGPAVEFLNPVLSGGDDLIYCLTIFISIGTVILLKHIEPLRQWRFINFQK